MFLEPSSSLSSADKYCTFGVDPSTTKIHWDDNIYFTALEQLSDLQVVPE